jgi:hypothetical protein
MINTYKAETYQELIQEEQAFDYAQNQADMQEARWQNK